MPGMRTILLVSLALVGGSVRASDLDADKAEASGILFRLRPVGANGPHIIEGQEILIQAGAEVTLELFLGGWAPAELSTFAALLACEDLTSATNGSLTPLETGSKVDESRPDYIFFDVPFLSTCLARYCALGDPDTIGCQGGAFLSSVPDTGEIRYAATFVVSVSEDAEGAFSLGFDLSPDGSEALDGNGSPIEPIKVMPATIRIYTSSLVIPTVSTWGLAATTLLLVTGGTLVLFHRRRRTIATSFRA